MKNCPYCGAQLEDDAGFCYYCMKKLVPEEMTFAPPKKKRKLLPAVLAVSAVLIVSGGVFAAFSFGKEAPEDPEPGIVETTLSETSAAPTEPSAPAAPTSFDAPTASVDESTGEISLSENTVTPTESTEIPTEPTEIPTEPTEIPTEPTEIPTEPTEPPTQPTETPVEPTETPVEPTETPVEPTETPVEPTETPVEPPVHTHVPVTDRGYIATCLKDGLSDGSHCEICGEVLEKQIVIPMIEHTPVVDEGYDATCTKDGLSFGSHCTMCGTVFEEQTVLPAFGHDYEKNVVQATCECDGYTEYSCINCGDFYTADVVKATGHDYKKTVVPATCESDGYTEYDCAVCGDHYTGDEVKATGHEWKPTEEVPATCYEPGTSAGEVCVKCGKTTATEIPPTFHSRVTYDNICYSCVEGGTVFVKCADCGDLLWEFEHPAGHFFGEDGKAGLCLFCGLPEGEYADETPRHVFEPEGKPVEPTCEEEGYRLYRCVYCEKTVKRDITPALGHEWMYEPGIPSTCIMGGLTDGQVCARCGLSTQEPTPPLIHEFWYEDTFGVYCCPECGAQMTAEEIEEFYKDFYEEWQWKLYLRPEDR